MARHEDSSTRLLDMSASLSWYTKHRVHCHRHRGLGEKGMAEIAQHFPADTKSKSKDLVEVKSVSHLILPLPGSTRDTSLTVFSLSFITCKMGQITHFLGNVCDKGEHRTAPELFLVFLLCGLKLHKNIVKTNV